MAPSVGRKHQVLYSRTHCCGRGRPTAKFHTSSTYIHTHHNPPVYGRAATDFTPEVNENIQQKEVELKKKKRKTTQTDAIRVPTVKLTPSREEPRVP